MELRNYIVPIGGLEHTMQLTPETAKRMGVEEATAAKRRAPRNKAKAPAANKAKPAAAAADKVEQPDADKSEQPDADKVDDPDRASDEDW